MQDEIPQGPPHPRMNRRLYYSPTLLVFSVSFGLTFQWKWLASAFFFVVVGFVVG